MQRTDMGRRVMLLLFMLLVFPVLVVSAVIVPTGEIPDEVAHIVRANSLLHGQIIGERRPRMDHAGQPVQDSGVVANLGLVMAGFSFIPGVRPKIMTRQRWDLLLAVPWAAAATWASVPNTSVYMPVFYVPAAAGMGLAHWAGFGPFAAIIAARLFNVAAFTVIALAALLLAERARGGILVALALPMTVSVAGSCNQDGLLIATTCLAVALLTRSSVSSLRYAAVALAVVLAAKPVYVPLALLLGVAAWLRGWSGRSSLLVTGATALPAVIWYAIAQRYAVVPFVRGEPYAAGPLWPGPPGQIFGTTDSAQQLRVFIRHPTAIWRLPYHALLDQYADLARETVGVLGTLDLLLPDWLYAVWWWTLGVVVIAQVFRTRQEPAGWPLWASLLGLVAILASLVAVFDGQYMSWTFVGASGIEGVQGRYLIPLVPFVALALPRLALPFGDKLRILLEAPLAVAACAALVTIPMLLVTTYYLR